MRHIGFTGTQVGMTPRQKAQLETILRGKLAGGGKVAFHHGDCIGADAEAATLAGVLGCYLVCHPPTNSSKRAFVKSNEVRPAKPYMERNLAIVLEAKVLLAAPKTTTEELRSGTWATIRRARKHKVPVVILVP